MQVTPVQSSLSIIFRVFCLVLPPLSLLASHGVVAFLLIAAAAACFVVWRAERRLPMPDRAITMAFAALLIWCAITSLWGFDTARSLVLVVRIGIIFAAAIAMFALAQRLDDRVRDGLGGWLLVGILVTLAIMMVEIAFGFPIFELITGQRADQTNIIARLNRGATAMALMVWPAAALLWRRGRVWAALILFAAVVMILSQMASGAALLGAAMGGLTAALALAHRKIGRAVVLTAMIVALAGTVLFAKEIARRDWDNAEWLEDSARHRVEIWNYTAGLIEQKPWTGWGFDAARDFGKDRLVDERGERQMLPLHPHNAPLQILLELGTVGAAIVFVLSTLLVSRIEGLPKPARVCGQALFISTLAVACTAFGLWQNQWLAMMCSAAVLFPLTFPSFATPAESVALSEAPRGAVRDSRASPD